MIRTHALLGIPLIPLAALLAGPGGAPPGPGTTPADPDAETIARPQESGADLFRSNCAGCHTLGGGDAMGPDLLGVHERREQAWLRAWVTDPSALAATDPEARALVERWGFPMPALGLDEASVDAVLAYVRSVSTGDAAAPAAPDGRCGMGRGPGPHRGPPPGMGSGGRGHRGHHALHGGRGHRGGKGRCGGDGPSFGG